jgi:hypothetical protein
VFKKLEKKAAESTKIFVDMYEPFRTIALANLLLAAKASTRFRS